MAAGSGASVRDFRPEPARFWIRFGPPRGWSCDRPWVDLATGKLGRISGWTPLSGWPPASLGDVTYCPPSRESFQAPERGPNLFLLQLFPGQVVPPRVWAVYDILEELISGKMDHLEDVVGGSSVVWPLLSGLTDTEELWEDGLDRLVGAGVHHVQPMALDLTPADRRYLAERAESAAFDRLFHAASPSERAFSSFAAQLGIEAFAERPQPELPQRVLVRRRVSAALAMTAELSLRTGGSEPRAQALFVAARNVEREDVDLEALVREGNLGVLPWLDDESRSIVTLTLSGEAGDAVDELRRLYVAGGDG